MLLAYRLVKLIENHSMGWLAACITAIAKMPSVRPISMCRRAN